MSKNDGGPIYAFPRKTIMHADVSGMTLRDYFAIHAPEPAQEIVDLHCKMDRNRNPNNDYHKPKIRSSEEIRAYLRYEFADKMIAARDA